MSKFTMVIPTYWGRDKAQEAAEEIVFDHPTMLHDAGTLRRLLESLRIFKRIEDIDFLLNARIQDITFYLDRKLAITHLPPASRQKEWKKVREDAIRFLYERKKLEDHPQLSLQELQPYPGMFLGADLEQRIIKTNELLKQKYQAENDEQGVQECEKTIAMTAENRWSQFDTGKWLSQLATRWQEITAAAEGIGFRN